MKNRNAPATIKANASTSTSKTHLGGTNPRTNKIPVPMTISTRPLFFKVLPDDDAVPMFCPILAN
jgi:hypothetical protein